MSISDGQGGPQYIQRSRGAYLVHVPTYLSLPIVLEKSPGTASTEESRVERCLDEVETLYYD